MPKCCKCQLSFPGIAIQRHPFENEGWINVKQRINKEVTRNGQTAVISTFETKRIKQVPALVCEGCYADLTETPEGDPIYVTKTSHLEK